MSTMMGPLMFALTAYIQIYQKDKYLIVANVDVIAVQSVPESWPNGKNR